MIRLPRIGKIKIGKKDEKDIPQGLDYFIIDSDYSEKVFEVYHRKDKTDETKKLPPNIIRIAFPSNDIEANLDEMYRWYGASGLKCTGDGETFNRFVDIKEPEEGCPCHLAVPPEGQKQQCFISMRMSFIILGIGVTGIWQFVSKSIYSMSSVRAAMKMVRDTTGRLAGIPFYMRVEMQKSALADNPHVFPVVSVDCAMDLEELMAQNLKILAPAETKQLEPKIEVTKEIPVVEEEQTADEAPKKVFKNIFVQKKWNEFNKWLEEYAEKLDKEMYDTARKWLDKLDDRTDTKQLTINLAKLKKQIADGPEAEKSDSKYKRYHEDLITEIAKILKTDDRAPIVQTLTNMVKSWKIEGLEELSDASENQCINLLAEFDQMQLDEKKEPDLPY